MVDDAERIAWLERQVVGLMRTVITGMSLFAGWGIARGTVGDGDPWLWFAVFIGTWLLVGFILERSTFKGAPSHIKFIG